MSKKQRPKNRKKKYQGVKPKYQNFIGFTLEHWKGWGVDNDHDGKAELRDRRGILRGPEYWDQLCKFEYRWKILARVQMRVPGEDRDLFKDYEIVTQEKCKLNDLEEVYKECEAELMAKTQKKHIVDSGWWACVIE
jgi:hypothetical protein